MVHSLALVHWRINTEATKRSVSALLARMKARNIKLHPSISRVKKKWDLLINTQAKSLGEESSNTRYGHKNLIRMCMVLTTLKTELVTMYPKKEFPKKVLWMIL